MKDTLVSRRMAAKYLGTSKRYLKALIQTHRLFPARTFPERWSKQDLKTYKQELGRDITRELEISLVRSSKMK